MTSGYVSLTFSPSLHFMSFSVMDMPSPFAIMEFVKNYQWICENRPEYEDLIHWFELTIRSGFICFDYDDILRKYEKDRQLHERLLRSNICSSRG